MIKNYTLPKIIKFLEHREFEKFVISNHYAYIRCLQTEEIIIDAPDNQIPEETAEQAIEVLNHLDECVSKANSWLSHFNLKGDKWYPDALDNGFEICGIYFGKYGYSHNPYPLTDGFAISFSTKNYYPCAFTVKYFYRNLWPFAVEEWVI